MCMEPHNLGEGVLVACRNCWQCRANRVNDLVGRCIAENETSSASIAVTLTYAGDAPNSAVLVYRDFQLFMKRLRKRGYDARYIVAGEYGSTKGRAHWHAVLFFKGEAPETAETLARREPWQIVLDRRFNWEPWPHGYAFAQQPDMGGYAYILKYALKNTAADVAKGHLAMSKKPPLGHEYFQEYARRYVAQGLAPQDLFYSFGHVFDAERKRKRFLMQGKTRENFIERYIEEWRATYEAPCPISEALEAHWDKQARVEITQGETDEHWRAHRAQWPKYVTEAVSADTVDQWELEWDLAVATTKREVPLALYDVAPPDLIAACDTGPIYIEFAQVADRLGDCLTLIWQHDGREMWWHERNPEAASRLISWLRE